MSLSPDAPPTVSPRAAITIRSAHQQDVGSLADLLASSFHRSEGWLGWLYPLLRAGIYEDLHHRLRQPAKHYACLAAIDRSSPGPPLPRRSSQPSQSSPCWLRSHTRPSTHGVPLVGTVEISTKSQFLLGWGEPAYLYVSNLAIQETYRRQGIATALLRECDDLAQSWGFQSIYLHVLEDNQAARQLYRAAGYQVEAVLGDWLSQFLGRSRRLLMRKVIR